MWGTLIINGLIYYLGSVLQENSMILKLLVVDY